MSSHSSMLQLEASMDVDKLTYEIFSILENNFLFGSESGKKNDPKLASSKMTSPVSERYVSAGKVRILSMDGGGATDGILAAKSLAHLEATLRRKSGNPNAHVADYFDVVAGAGAGGVLAALMFTHGRDGSGNPMFTAEGALRFLLENGRRMTRTSPAGIFRRDRRPGKVLRKVFGEMSLRDTLKGVLIPCYDLATCAPFLFSRADALEMDGCDFSMGDVCGATIADRAVEVKSVDGRRKIVAVGGGVAMNNPTAAAITHVLHNKHEFPLCRGVEDLLVVSLGNGESDTVTGDVMSSPAAFVKIAGDGASDMVDQAVAMAFAQRGSNNYVRIQGNALVNKRGGDVVKMTKNTLTRVEEMMEQKNVESLLFQGKKLVGRTNLDKLEWFASELIKEQERRKTTVLPPVVLKQQASPSPRTSSATTLSTSSSY